jgi:hypothetical protein
MMQFKLCFWVASALTLGIGVTAQAQDYRPDIIEMNGTFELAFEPDPAFTLADEGTVEFWAQPDWTEDPGFDPVLLSNIGPDGPSYIIAISGDREAVVVVSGEEEDVFTFDFTDGKMHHIAINQFSDGINVLVDGEVVGDSDMNLQDLDSDGLWVGSVDGEISPFYGAIAGLRFWDYVPERDTLLVYAQRDVVLDEHPELEQLSAISDFAMEDMLILQEIE